jgi:hypothetical protein
LPLSLDFLGEAYFYIFPFYLCTPSLVFIYS